MKKEYSVTFIGHHIIDVEANNEKEAEEKAMDLFDGYVDWEMEVEEVENE